MASESSEPYPTELIFLGTGTSGSLPVISCLTSPLASTPQRCKTCTSSNPRNARLNTSAIFRIHSPSTPDIPKTLLIDCGKTFFHSATRHFPAHGLRKIDALLLTHAHADAIFGLDDLRAWTMPNAAAGEGPIQDHVDVYCDATTMGEVERTFPYLVDRNRATGGGDVPKFVWHVFDSSIPGPDEIASDVEPGFTIPEIDGLRVIPLPVAHGMVMNTGEPFLCMGFRVGDFSYVSDCSGVPAGTWARMCGSRVVVMDGLKWDGHASHFSIQQGREWVRDNLGVNGRGKELNGITTDQTEIEDHGPERTWLVGFSHNVEHDHATSECQTWGLHGEGRGMWVRPAWDGLRVGMDGAEIKEGFEG